MTVPRKMATAYVFLDTMTFLHYQWLAQIDWPALVGYRNVCIVITPTILSELDKHKNDPSNQRRQGRARDAIPRLVNLLRGTPPDGEVAVPQRPNVRIRYTGKSPQLARYPDLQPSVNDDVFLASVLDFWTSSTPGCV